MAPTFKSIEDDRPLPERMYLDAGVFVRALATPHSDHQLTLKFIKETVLGPPRLYTSAIIFSEVNDALYKYLLKRRGDGDLISVPKVVPDEVWEEVQNVSMLLEGLVSLAHIEPCKADGGTRVRAWRLQRAHQMRSFDAIHAATCLQRGIDDLVCFDEDFHDPMDGYVIWTSTEMRDRWVKRAAARAAGPPKPVSG